MAAAPERVEKIMALGIADFHRGLKALAPELSPGGADAAVSIALDGAQVRIEYEALESARLGGLLALPRARVTLTFAGQDEPARARFLARFDRAFQRGGG